MKDIYPNKSFKFNIENITKDRLILADLLFDQLIINVGLLHDEPEDDPNPAPIDDDPEGQE